MDGQSIFTMHNISENIVVHELCIIPEYMSKCSTKIVYMSTGHGLLEIVKEQGCRGLCH